MLPNIKKLNWELKTSEPGDTSVYEKIYKEFKRIELELITEYNKGFLDKKKVSMHSKMNKLLSGTPPFWVDEYTIYEKLKDLEDEGAFTE